MIVLSPLFYMMNMMNTTGFGSGLISLWGLHVLSVIVFFAGVILLILWAAKSLNAAQLKLWGITLAVIGTVLCLFTIAASPFNSTWGGFGPNVNVRSLMMERGMDDDDVEEMMDEVIDRMMGGDDADDADDDHMGMSMEDMSADLEGKTGDAFDKAFLEGMIPHHQGAIDMAKMALTNAKHGEIREMAIDIIAAQQQEIDMMNQWLKDWGYAN